MQTIKLIATAALLMLSASAAWADEAPASMMLTCSGTDVVAQQTGSSTTVKVTPGMDPGIGSAQHRAAVIANTASTSATTTPTFGFARVPARMSVAIEGGSVRIRPSENSRPGFGQKKSADGWYSLSEVEITDTEIRGRAGFGSTLGGKYKLSVDRRTGDVKFGDFRGVCDRAATGPSERRF